MKMVRVLAIIFLVVFGIAARWILTTRHTPISRHAYNRIRLGMSKEDVLAIMVVPPRDYRTLRGTSLLMDGVKEGESSRGVDMAWASNSAIVQVTFDEEGRVRWKAFRPVFPYRSWSYKIRYLYLKSYFKLVGPARS